MFKLLIGILLNNEGGTLAITRKTSNTLITAAGFNTNYDEIEAVINGVIEAANLAADSVTAVKVNADVVRADNGLKQHTDGTLYVDVSDTNPSLEISDGGLRAKVYGMINRTTNGLTMCRTGDVILSSSATTPDGWNDVSATYADKNIRISSTALSTGGSDTLSGNTGSHVLTEAELASHTHGVTVPVKAEGSNGSYVESSDNAAALNNVSLTSDAAGSGDGHTHTLTSVSCVAAYISLKAYQKA